MRENTCELSHLGTTLHAPGFKEGLITTDIAATSSDVAVESESTCDVFLEESN
jgi:hypothetical protein